MGFIKGLSLDEAIKHCLEVADNNKDKADKYDRWDEWESAEADNCLQCATDHQQLAEWLTELKQWRRVYGICPSYEMCIPECREGYDAQIAEYKRLLKSAANVLNMFIPCDEDYNCSECIKQRQNCEYDDSFKWRYADEVEKLLNDEK